MIAVYLATIAVMLACGATLGANEVLQLQGERLARLALRVRLAFVAALIVVCAKAPLIAPRLAVPTVRIRRFASC